VPGSTFVIGQRHPCGCVVSFLLFTFAAPHTVSAISRTSLLHWCWCCEPVMGKFQIRSRTQILFYGIKI